MNLLRAILVTLLMVTLLPWGAYAHAGRAEAAMPEAQAAGGAGITLSGAPQKTVLSVAPKRCRTAALPGTSCSPHGLMPEATDLPASESRAAAPPRSDAPPAGRIPPTAQEPPRSC